MSIISTKIERDIETFRTRITIEIDDQHEMDCPKPPPGGAFGDDWIALSKAGTDTEHLLESDPAGYWSIPPESIAMHLLRAGWVAAHREAKNVREES